MSQIERMRSIIENECFLQDIEPDFISKGCEYAIYEYEQSADFAKSIGSGVAVALKCQYNSKWSIESLVDTTMIIQSTSAKYKIA